MAASRHLFAGHRVRALRKQLGISQGRMAAGLGISVSYLSQIESGDRPLTPAVLTSLAANHPGDWAMIDPEEDANILVQMTEACAVGPEGAPDGHEIQRLLRQHPVIARRLVTIFGELRRSEEQLRVLDEQVDSGSTDGRLPWDEVRDWFHIQQNYVDHIDREAELIGMEDFDRHPADHIIERLKTRFGVTVEPFAKTRPLLREYDPAERILRIDPAQPPETTLFSMAHLVGRFEFADTISSIATTSVRSEAGRQLLAAGLANYAAGAILMPYRAFRDAARECRHDVDELRLRFGTSFEQTCHRLSTLQRPGALGMPVFFYRVDMAGNITKRHSATRMQFARFGGACPLWIAHEAVAIPDRILVQLAETPDGARYVSMAKGLVKPSVSFSRSPRRYAVALGCEEQFAPEFVYADMLRTGGATTKIGNSCRICPRNDCEQRAFPPAASRVEIDPFRRGPVPYLFD